MHTDRTPPMETNENQQTGCTLRWASMSIDGKSNFFSGRFSVGTGNTANLVHRQRPADSGRAARFPWRSARRAGQAFRNESEQRTQRVSKKTKHLENLEWMLKSKKRILNIWSKQVYNQTISDHFKGTNKLQLFWLFSLFCKSRSRFDRLILSPPDGAEAKRTRGALQIRCLCYIAQSVYRLCSALWFTSFHWANVLEVCFPICCLLTRVLAILTWSNETNIWNSKANENFELASKLELQVSCFAKFNMFNVVTFENQKFSCKFPLNFI